MWIYTVDLRKICPYDTVQLDSVFADLRLYLYFSPGGLLNDLNQDRLWANLRKIFVLIPYKCRDRSKMAAGSVVVGFLLPPPQSFAPSSSFLSLALCLSLCEAMLAKIPFTPDQPSERNGGVTASLFRTTKKIRGKIMIHTNIKSGGLLRSNILTNSIIVMSDKITQKLNE